MAEKFYITTSIVYTNAAPHIGFAYELLIADIIARYKRVQLGKDNVYFLTGTDEHGTKIWKTAEAKGIDTQDFVDENSKKVKELAKALGTDEHDFIRTSDKKRHWPGAQKLWKEIEKDLEKRKYKGFYCEGHESFHAGSGIVNGECTDYPGKKLALIEEENWFFKIKKYLPEIRKKIESDTIKIIPESRKREIVSLIDEGVEDVSFSRSIKSNPWGIPVPGDETQTMYVWCDALSNYITALGYGQSDDSNFEKFWPANVHLIGKDIVRFHAIIWPAMLMSAGLPLPKEILVHGFITVDGKKMSKSLGNVIDPMELIKKYGVEAFRYYFAREISPFEDGDFSEKKFVDAYNANLANGLGNLVARTIKMATSYGVSWEDYMGDDTSIHNYPGVWDVAYNNFNLKKVADHIWEKIGALDSYIQENEPYKKIKTDEASAKKDVAYVLSHLLRISYELEPFMPNTAFSIRNTVIENKMLENLFPRIENK